jgi:DNA replication protein DnaC
MTNRIAFNTVVEDELSSRKSAALRELSAHYKNIKENYPAIEALRQELIELSLDLSYKIINAPKGDDSIGRLASELVSQKEKELADELKAQGLPEDYLKLRPRCPVCGDRGIVDGQMCRCLKRLVIEKSYPGAGLDPKQSFETFRSDLLSDPKERRFRKRVFDYCVSYADSFPNNEQPDLMLLGSPGVGKTFLLNCIGGRVLDRGYSVLRITANRLIQRKLEVIRREAEEQDLLMPDLLIIDDLGTEPMVNNVTVETILSVICERQDSNKPTLFASNKELADVNSEYGDRVASRLTDPNRVKLIKIQTESMRLIKA